MKDSEDCEEIEADQRFKRSPMAFATVSFYIHISYVIHNKYKQSVSALKNGFLWTLHLYCASHTLAQLDRLCQKYQKVTRSGPGEPCSEKVSRKIGPTSLIMHLVADSPLPYQIKITEKIM